MIKEQFKVIVRVRNELTMRSFDAIGGYYNNYPTLNEIEKDMDDFIALDYTVFDARVEKAYIKVEVHPQGA